eukprot:Clim_evm66s22 gene=Clim_evmTU66s22
MVKEIESTEVAQHNTRNSVWLTIHGKVYDVTDFMDEHPGGEEVLLEVAGRDSTSEFEDVGHSPNAVDMMDKYLVGSLKGAEQVDIKKLTEQKEAKLSAGGQAGIFPGVFVLLGVLALAAAIFYM